VLYVSGSGASATLRYRVRLPEEALRSKGVDTLAVHFTDPAIADLAPLADVVVLYRVPAGAELLALLAELRRGPNPPLVAYDVDDLVFRTEHLAAMGFLDSFSADDRARFSRDVALRGELVGQADLLTGSTAEVLAELSEQALVSGPTDGHGAPTALLPNGVGLVGARIADAARRVPRGSGAHGSGAAASPGLRLGYFSGSATHDGDWATVEPVVLDFLARHRDARLVLVGQVTPSDAVAALGSRLEVVDAVPWRELPALLRSVDVNLVPLERTVFTEAKSAIKWLEAALVETPTIATPTGPFLAAVEAGVTGLLADGPEQWAAALEQLADAGVREQMGAAARESAVAQYGPKVQAERLHRVLSDGLERPAAEPVAHVPALAAAATPTNWRRFPVLLERYPWPADLESRQIPVPLGVRARDETLRNLRLARRAEAKAVRMVKRAILRVVRPG
jgi:hypothetical protein